MPTPSFVRVESRHFLDLATPPKKLRDELTIEVSEHAFLPQVIDLRTDWVSSVATPAFKLIRQRQGPQAAFASIGTGTGMDALAAIETLGASRVGVTDLHDDVVSAAQRNISANVLAPHAITIEAGVGDLLSPLKHFNPRYDVIYENLPNVPTADSSTLGQARISSSFVPPRSEPAPAIAQQNMVTLHYLALQQARDFLNPYGSILSTIGGRFPLSVFLEIVRLAGLKGDIFTYTWKNQTDPDTILQNYVQKQRSGLGPFHFYRVDALEKVFSGIHLSTSGFRAFEIEAALAQHRLSPEQALSAHQQGEKIGHTVVVLRSRWE